jgi:hypothetical protein
MRRAFAWLLTIMLFVIAAGAGSIYLVNRHIRSTAGAILRDIQSLRIGESTSDDSGRIVRRYRGYVDDEEYASACPDADVRYAIRVNDYLRGLALRWSLLKRVGLLPTWGATAMILLSKGRVCYLFYSLEATSRNDVRELRARLNVTSPGALGIGEVFSYHAQSSLVRGTYDTMEVWVTPDYATSLERQHAFDFDLSCLSSFWGCRAACELMPSAWLDYEKEAREKGWALLPYEVKNCPRS